jgi:hypothetical protein
LHDILLCVCVCNIIIRQRVAKVKKLIKTETPLRGAAGLQMTGLQAEVHQNNIITVIYFVQVQSAQKPVNP